MTKQAIKEAPKKEPHKFLEFTISGSYYNSKRESFDFENVVGKIPYCDEEGGVGSMHVRGRFAAKWIREARNEDGTLKYPERIEKLRQVFIDDVRETTGTLSYVGKSIKELDIHELQELATAKDLRGIPLPNSGMSKRDVLIRAYADYSHRVLGKKIDYQAADFNFAKLPDITLDDAYRVETQEKISNEEILEMAQKPTVSAMGEKDDPKKVFSIEELRQVADSKKIKWDESTSFDELYNNIFAS